MSILKLPLLLLGMLWCASYSTASTALDPSEDDRQLRRRDTILEIAESNGFNTLVTALEIAGFDDEFDCKWKRGEKCPKYTVFAPTDDAFKAVDQKLLATLTTEKEYIEHLRGLLKYHVLPARVTTKKIRNGDEPKTLLGETVTATKKRKSQVKINDANVVAPNIKASNGVVHVIDSVLVPSFVTNDIVDVAQSNPSTFSTLVAAAGAAGLVDALKGDGPFTVFAPTNEAFAKLGTTLDDLLKPENKDTLANILKYHVLSGIVVREELKDGPVNTLLGKDIEVDVNNRGQVTLNGGVHVTDFNILASNGIIHAIDTVLLPPEEKPDIVEIASSATDFSKLVEAVAKAGLVETLQGDGPFTVFAPTNEAFEKLGMTFKDLLREENRETLKNILLYHVIPGEVKSSDLRDGPVTSVLGKDILVDVRYFLWRFRGAKLNGDTRVTDFDIKASNGIIHTINKVLIPPEPLPDLVTLASSDSTFSTLVAAVQAAGLVDTLQNGGPFTVFAPTNEAFAKLLKKLGTTLEDLTAPDNIDTLTNILLYHVVPGKVPFHELPEGSLDTALPGESLHVDLKYRWYFKLVGATINGNSDVLIPDIEASNGIIHVIDEVLLPSSL